jgi:hypothetical protein
MGIGSLSCGSRGLDHGQSIACSTIPARQDFASGDVCFDDVPLTAVCRFDCSDVDLFYLHHRIERTLGDGRVGIGYRSR